MFGTSALGGGEDPFSSESSIELVENTGTQVGIWVNLTFLSYNCCMGSIPIKAETSCIPAPSTF